MYSFLGFLFLCVQVFIGLPSAFEAFDILVMGGKGLLPDLLLFLFWIGASLGLGFPVIALAIERGPQLPK